MQSSGDSKTPALSITTGSLETAAITTATTTTPGTAENIAPALGMFYLIVRSGSVRRHVQTFVYYYEMHRIRVAACFIFKYYIIMLVSAA